MFGTISKIHFAIGVAICVRMMICVRFEIGWSGSTSKIRFRLKWAVCCFLYYDHLEWAFYFFVIFFFCINKPLEHRNCISRFLIFFLLFFRRQKKSRKNKFSSLNELAVQDFRSDRYKKGHIQSHVI